ncbi:class D beta-lactamase [bacterium]|nr:class D beta-lactamase [bacterium]
MVFRRRQSSLIFEFALLFVLGSCTSETDLSTLFHDRNVEGTILISALDGKTNYVYNQKRAQQRYLPASTFKIPNTLIALEEEVISSKYEIIKWDGQVRAVEAWNRDHSLNTAFPVSCVWFYQELAERVGNGRYLHYLKELDYGNQLTGQDLRTFWLSGDLKISAEEQVEFLKKLYRNELPFKQDYIKQLKDMMILEQTASYTLRAKTGWAIRKDKQHGWFVGYLEAHESIWFFATQIDILSNADAKYSQEITLAAFRKLGLI